jgi:putative ABC transport system permease protein
MLLVTWRNLFARKVRLLLSAFAIVLGVAFVAGSLAFTDTLAKTFDGIVEGSVPDAVVRLDGAGLDENGGFLPDQRTIPADLVAALADVPGVARADGTVEGQGMFVVDSDGKLVGGQGAPTFGFNYNDAPSITGEPSVTVASGRAPQGPDEVMLDERAAEGAGYDLGDTISLVTARADEPLIEAELVGTAAFAGGGTAGATLVLFDTPTAQDIFLEGKDAFTSISLTADPGVSQQELVDGAATVVPDGMEAVTGEVVAAEQEDLIGTALGFISTFLLIFAAIAVVVGTFLIINTFSILVAQRSRELALLRALGASRRQVTRSVLLESLVVGFIGSTLGLLVGLGLATALRALFSAFGLDTSGTPLQITARTVIVSYLVGMVVTLFAAYLPARRASRVAPVAAMRDDIALPESSIRRRLIVGLGLAVVGAGLMTAGLLGEGGSGARLVGLGVFAILIAVALMSPVLGRPVLLALGVIYRRLFGTVGALATQNSLRNPRRTAATASALMIGLALVATMAVLGASTNKSIEVSVQQEFTTDFLISSPTFLGYSTSIADDAEALPESGEVVRMQGVFVDADGEGLWSTAADPALVAETYELEVVDGSVDVSDGQIAISDNAAEERGLGVGDTMTLEFPAGEQKAEVAGIFEVSNVIGDALMPFSTLEAAQIPRQDLIVGIDAAEGVDRAELGTKLDALVEDLPTVTVQDQEEFTESQRAQVDQLLYLIYGLLGLAIVIAVLGIINTLALSVIERTREVGLLRAVGLSRRQLRRMVRLEAIAIAVLGAVLGVVMGLVFGFVLQRAVADQGITDLAIPGWSLAIFVVLAGVVGVLAAVLPARRAAKLNVLRAITTE